ncbi:MAG: DUF2721 domain-containing protein [Pseudomonadota bacterium]|jgi:hypothetical protein
MQDPAGIASVSHVIQLAVAPVFLLTGVGAILSVLINRLARVVDRFRTLECELQKSVETAVPVIKGEMNRLSRRARMIHWSIGLCTSCALFVCLVIGLMFFGSVIGANLSTAISVLFIVAMLTLIAGLLCFLREITLARSSIHVLPR